jgi:hypothetical protein
LRFNVQGSGFRGWRIYQNHLPQKFSFREEIEDTICQLKGEWKSVWGIMGEKEYGIGGA